jgi:glycosyltransferase involved in cell wall biosynthesis
MGEVYKGVFMISVVIPFYDNCPEKKEVLKRTVESFRDYDELILVWNDGMGMSKAVNKGFELARGDFIVMASDDAYFIEGSFKDLAIPGVVTSPKVNNHFQAFSGVMFCVPRDIYEKYGMWDEEYSKGIYFEDEDYWLMLKANKIPHACIESAHLVHSHGGLTLTKTPNYDEKTAINKAYFNKKWGLNK